MRRFDKTVAVNLRTPFALLQASLPLLRTAADADLAGGAKVIALARWPVCMPRAAWPSTEPPKLR